MASVVGIDIGSRFIKVVQVEQRARLQLVKASLFPTPYSKEAPRKIDAEEFFNKVISTVPVSVLKSSYLGINIPSSSVTVVVVQLPKMSRKELAIASAAEARRKMVPTPGPNSIFQHMVLGEVIVSKIPRYEVLVVKTEKGCIDDIFQTFNAFAGINPYLISPTCYTSINLFPRNSPPHKTDSAFVDIGYDSIDVTISKKGNLRFYRNIKLGLRDIISHMSNSLGITPDETEEVIKQKGVPEVEIDLKDKVKVAEEIMRQKYEASVRGEDQQGINLLELRMLWDTEIERIVQEIRRTLVYYREQSKGSRVDNIFFLGGGAPVKELVPTLSKGLGGQCQVISPFDDIDIDLNEEEAESVKQTAALFAPAISITSSVPLLKKKERIIDFLPAEIRKQEAAFQRQLGIITFAIIVFAFTFLGWLKVFIDNNLVKESINRLNFRLKRAEDFVNKLDEVKSQRRLINERWLKVKVILDQRADVTPFMEDVAALIPDKVYLKAVYLGKRIEDKSEEETAAKPQAQLQPEDDENKPLRMRINALCYGDYEEVVNLSQDFKNALSGSKYFTKVRLNTPDLEKITPIFDAEAEVILTQPMLREFTLEAEIADNKE